MQAVVHVMFAFSEFANLLFIKDYKAGTHKIIVHHLYPIQHIDEYVMTKVGVIEQFHNRL